MGRNGLRICFASVFLLNASFFAGYGQTTTGKTHASGMADINSSLRYDTSRIAILPFNINQSSVFPKDCTPAKLTQADIELIYQFVTKGTDEHNKATKNNKIDFKIDFRKYDYKMQLVAVINARGEKEVWVNCFCDSSNFNWKKDILMVMDGGPCFFSLKINLTTKKYYDLAVNGVA